MFFILKTDCANKKQFSYISKVVPWEKSCPYIGDKIFLLNRKQYETLSYATQSENRNLTFYFQKKNRVFPIQQKNKVAQKKLHNNFSRRQIFTLLRELKYI